MAGVLDYLSTKAPRWSAALWDGMLRTVDARFRPLEEALDAQREATSALVARGLQVIEDELAPAIAEGRDVLVDIKDVLDEAEDLRGQAETTLAAAVAAGINRSAGGSGWLNYTLDGGAEARAGIAPNGAYQLRLWNGTEFEALLSATLADGVTITGPIDVEELKVGGQTMPAPANIVPRTGPKVLTGRTTVEGSFIVSGGSSVYVQTPGVEGTTSNNPSGDNIAGAATVQPGLVAASRASNPAADFNRGTAGALMQLRFGGGGVGSISVTETAASFNTSSDHRLKTGVVDLVGSGAFIDALRPVDFYWLADGTPDQGFIAHEFAVVCPRAVTGTKDEVGVDDDGNTVQLMQGMQASAPAVMANVVAELQALRRRVAELEAASAA